MSDEQLHLSNQVCFPLYSVSRLFTKAYKPHLDKMGLTYPQYLVLLVLWENDNLTVNQIAKKLILNTNTLSPLLKRMEKNNLLERVQSTKDERVLHIRLKTKGLELKKDALCLPEKLGKNLITPNIQLKEIMQLKDTLDEWIELLTKQEK